MKIFLTRHVIEDKIPRGKLLGWNITKLRIKQTVIKPLWKGITKQNQETAMSLMDKRHILRVIFKRENGIIIVITVHVARRGTYESTKEN
ncbi:MAG: hypothetical protein Q7R97_00325 [Candidatus Daviesbacteria bacterium]|nr:hypothetical protein [Candidatus Daviesbacteria bacterium]